MEILQHPAPVSPVMQAHWDIWKNAQLAADHASDIAHGLRARLVDAYGEPQSPVATLWAASPDYPKLMPLNAESDRLANASAERLEELMDCPSTCFADLCLKLSIVMQFWREDGLQVEEHGEYHERITVKLLNDAEPLLRPALPVVEECFR